MLKVFKVYIRPCDIMHCILKSSNYVAFKLIPDADKVSILIRVDVDRGNDVNAGIKWIDRRMGIASVSTHPGCIISWLLKKFYVVEVNSYSGLISVTLIITSKKELGELKSLIGSLPPCIVDLEEIDINNIILDSKDIELMRLLISSGFLDYPKKTRYIDLSRSLSKSKSTVNYMVRRLLKKLLIRLM